MDATVASPESGATQPVMEMIGVSTGSLRDPLADALRNVDWTVRAGQFWVVVGMHNSGKSDLLALAAGLIRPRSGEYRLLGRDMTEDEAVPMDLRLRVGLVFEGGRMLHHLTVAENVALPLRYHEKHDEGAIRERVEGVLRLANLSEFADGPAASQVQAVQKRCGLARALVPQPEVLLVDNPLAGLDPRESAWWIGTLRRLAAGHPILEGRPLTLVVASDDFQPWRRLGARFALLNEKRLTVLGGDEQLSGHTDMLVKELLAEKSDDA
jgi:ABC-type transporter Mla maintaining outer membrane lipid asymmetry ATPase subunit MlaF